MIQLVNIFYCFFMLVVNPLAAILLIVLGMILLTGQSCTSIAKIRAPS
jgi:hypothetical protein